MRFGQFEFDARRRRLTRGRQPVHLTPKAFDVLSLLIDAAPRVVSKKEIHERIWRNHAVSDATLVGVVKEIRRALDDTDTARHVIRTVHRVGYAFDAPLEGGSHVVVASCLLVFDDRRLQLTDGDNVVGRDPECDVWIDQVTVSRRHARIVLDSGRASLADLGSKNGTYVEERSLAGITELHDGDRIRFGRVQATFRTPRSVQPTETQLSVAD